MRPWQRRLVSWSFLRLFLFLFILYLALFFCLDQIESRVIQEQLRDEIKQWVIVDTNDDQLSAAVHQILASELYPLETKTDANFLVVGQSDLVRSSPMTPNQVEEHILSSQAEVGELKGIYWQKYPAPAQRPPQYLLYPQKYFTVLNALFQKIKLYLALIIAVIFVLGRILIYQCITKPVRQMSNQLNTSMASDFSYRSISSNLASITDLDEAAGNLVDRVKEESQKYKDSEGRLALLLDHLNLGVVLIDENDQIEIINPEAVSILNLKTRMVDRPFDALIQSVRLVELIETVQVDGQRIQEEIEFYIPESRMIDVNIIPYQFGLQTEAHRSILVLLYDITRNRKLETIRTEFVANASHELRTPVTAIKGFSETLLDGALDDPTLAKQFVSIIAKESHRLEVIIGDILELSRVEKKDEPLEGKVFDLVESGQTILKLFDKKVTDKDIKTNFSSNKSHLPIHSNQHRVEQIMTNLIDNAINYSEQGGELLLAVEEVTDGFLIQVSDTGIGIPEEDQERIFERFYRVDKGRSRNSGGTGLGLSIVRNLVKLLGGTITVSSQVGKGSTFKVFLPKN